MDHGTVKYVYTEPDQGTGSNPALRILICDDDEAVLEKCTQRIEALFRGSELRLKLHAYSDASQISTQLLASCDIALLDIDLERPDCNGLDLARRLRALRRDAVILFITNYIEYAPEGYEVQAFRYLLKRRLDTELERSLLQAVDQLKTAVRTWKIQINGEIIDLPLDDILYMEVRQHTVSVYVQRDVPGKPVRAYSFYASLSDLEAQLESRGFLRIHKSYLVNMRHLRKFQCREATLSNGVTLRVSEKSYAQNKQKYLLWKGWN